MHGLDKSRLRRVHDVLSGSVERKGVPGLVALVSREDDVHVEVLGTLSTDQTGPMKRDTIFRIASITKPIAAVAAMILIVECKMRLEDPIERWIPELANRRVLRSLSSQNRRYWPALRPWSSGSDRKSFSARTAAGDLELVGHQEDRHLPDARTIWMGRRLRHVGLHRSRRANDRNSLHAEDDGFADPPKVFADFWTLAYAAME